jgi:hypothetical protein
MTVPTGNCSCACSGHAKPQIPMVTRIRRSFSRHMPLAYHRPLDSQTIESKDKADTAQSVERSIAILLRAKLQGRKTQMRCLVFNSYFRLLHSSSRVAAILSRNEGSPGQIIARVLGFGITIWYAASSLICVADRLRIVLWDSLSAARRWHFSGQCCGAFSLAQFSQLQSGFCSSMV